MARMATKQPELTDIYAGGWRLWTGLPLPGTIAWPAAAGQPDVTFATGAVPDSLVDPMVDRPVLQMTADGTALVRLESIGYFLVEGSRVTCDLCLQPDAPELVPAVFGNVLAAICWRRGQLALHGSAVAIDGRAVLLLGRIATGKSVLAAALARRGHILLADEVATVAGGDCFPAGAPLQLADDALIAAGVDPTGLPRYDAFALAKRHWSFGPAPEPRPYPVSAVFCLEKTDPDAALAPCRLQGDAAEAAILREFYWTDMLDVQSSRAWAEREVTRLGQGAGIYRFPVPRRLDRLDETAAEIERIAATN